jgi:iron(III) transport system substrate-binding protein
LALFLTAGTAPAQETLNAYSIWPENWARPMFQEFEKATGVKVNFIRFSSGEALARIIAEKNNPRVDVLFGGPVETHIAGIKEGVFEPYKPPAFAELAPRFKDPQAYWVGIADDPLVFMSNKKFLKEKGLTPPVSWNDLLNPAYKGMIQMADARTSGTAVTRIFSILEVNGRDENTAFDYLKKLRQNVQVYTKSGGGGTIPVGLAQAGGGIFFIVDALRPASRATTWRYPSEGGERDLRRGDRSAQGRQEPQRRQEADRLGREPRHAELLRPLQDQFHPGPPEGEDRGVSR